MSLRRVTACLVALALPFAVSCADLEVPTAPSASACSLVLSSSSRVFDHDGGASSVSVWAPSGCAWAVTATASWVEIVSGEHGEGNGLIAFSVAPNDTLHVRSAVIVVETEMVTVTQSAENSTVPARLRAPGRSARIAGPH